MHDSKERNIWVRTYQASNMVAIEVRDSGEGIEEKYHKKYLNPIIPQKGKSSKRVWSWSCNLQEYCRALWWLYYSALRTR